ncbi:uncharacterized protein SCHCODRAFT_02628239 [Schizophyllum commune H4-8]|uniref:Expressed protein n=1 Tax=Schizophyllum commune (strain H4-8 / FGSC 9210) TaxID=578458 RepID=D8Q894_SCHCM|nr:uncharacterized protein SCHCODRAFT_02628239 [Schizophyllum commune H4-8]KAI5891155.1 hypothetical protein SCHCODRAFT_02628239 [Schizophyllum commune H4-8]
MKFTFVLAIFALAGTAFAETNAERFRRGLGPLKPRHFGTQTTQVAQPSGHPATQTLTPQQQHDAAVAAQRHNAELAAQRAAAQRSAAAAAAAASASAHAGAGVHVDATAQVNANAANAHVQADASVHANVNTQA